MTMPRPTIDALVEDLQPSSPLRPRQAVAGVLGVLAVAVGVVAIQYGLRPDIMAGKPHPMIMIREGTLLLLGGATLGAVLRAARPGVGQSSSEWLWALGAALLFPATALILSVTEGRIPIQDIASRNAYYCLGISLVSGLVIGAVLTAWLRRGAPTNLAQAGWLVGLSSGSFGAFAYGLHCPSISIYYVGMWYSLAVALCALIGRAIVPRLIRW